MDKIANKTARPIETMTKSISHATNLSVHLANLISVECISEDGDGSAIVDALTYCHIVSINKYSEFELSDIQCNWASQLE